MGMPYSKRSTQHSVDQSRSSCNPTRTVADVEKDAVAMIMPFHQALSKHIRQPMNRAQTLRIMRHLVIEQAIITHEGQSMASVLRWMVEGWPYRHAYDMYKGFLDHIQQAEEVCPERIENIRRVRDGFTSIMGPTLKAKLRFVLVEGPSTPERKKLKRYSDLPPIPEEHI